MCPSVVSRGCVVDKLQPIALPDGYAYIMVLEVMPKLYLNCMLTSCVPAQSSAFRQRNSSFFLSLNLRKTLGTSDRGHTDLELSGLSSEISYYGVNTRTTQSRVPDSPFSPTSSVHRSQLDSKMERDEYYREPSVSLVSLHSFASS